MMSIMSVFFMSTLPFSTARTAHQRFQQAPVVHNLLLQRGTLRAQRAAVGRMIGVALNVDDLRGHILRAVANRVDDRAATNSTVRTRRARLAGARDLQRAELRKRGLQIEAKHGGCSSAHGRYLQEITAGRVHAGPPPAGD